MSARTLIASMSLLALAACSDSNEPAQEPAITAAGQESASATASRPPEPPVQITTEDGVTRVTTAGNLQSTFDLDCIELAEVQNVYTPADLYKAAALCFASNQGDRAVKLFWLAAAYGGYDVMRVADRTAHQGLTMLQMNHFGEFPEADRKTISDALGAFRNDPAQWQAFCASVRTLGAPAYHPNYMIQHGLAAVRPWAAEGVNGLVADFDPVGAWQTLLDHEMGCSEGAAAAAAPAARTEQQPHPLKLGLMFAASSKTAVAEYYWAREAWPNSNAEAGLDPISVPPVAVSIGPGGIITIRFDAPAELAGKSMTLSPTALDTSGAMQWACSSTDIPPDQLRAGGCQ
jgi:hypothetical protein